MLMTEFKFSKEEATEVMDRTWKDTPENMQIKTSRSPFAPQTLGRALKSFSPSLASSPWWTLFSVETTRTLYLSQILTTLSSFVSNSVCVPAKQSWLATLLQTPSWARRPTLASLSASSLGSATTRTLATQTLSFPRSEMSLISSHPQRSQKW